MISEALGKVFEKIRILACAAEAASTETLFHTHQGLFSRPCHLSSYLSASSQTFLSRHHPGIPCFLYFCHSNSSFNSFLQLLLWTTFWTSGQTQSLHRVGRGTAARAGGKILIFVSLCSLRIATGTITGTRARVLRRAARRKF